MKWDDPLDPIVITFNDVLKKKRDILLVTHDEGHGGWQFLDGSDVKHRKPIVVPKDEIISLDPTIKEITDLPVGWRAKRTHLRSPWIREPNPDAD